MAMRPQKIRRKKAAPNGKPRRIAMLSRRRLQSFERQPNRRRCGNFDGVIGPQLFPKTIPRFLALIRWGIITSPSRRDHTGL